MSVSEFFDVANESITNIDNFGMSYDTSYVFIYSNDSQNIIRSLDAGSTYEDMPDSRNGYPFQVDNPHSDNTNYFTNMQVSYDGNHITFSKNSETHRSIITLNAIATDTSWYTFNNRSSKGQENQGRNYTLLSAKRDDLSFSSIATFESESTNHLLRYIYVDQTGQDITENILAGVATRGLNVDYTATSQYSIGAQLSPYGQIMVCLLLNDQLFISNNYGDYMYATAAIPGIIAEPWLNFKFNASGSMMILISNSTWLFDISLSATFSSGMDFTSTSGINYVNLGKNNMRGCGISPSGQYIILYNDSETWYSDYYGVTFESLHTRTDELNIDISGSNYVHVTDDGEIYFHDNEKIYKWKNVDFDENTNMYNWPITGNVTGALFFDIDVLPEESNLILDISGFFTEDHVHDAYFLFETNNGTVDLSNSSIDGTIIDSVIPSHIMTLNIYDNVNQAFNMTISPDGNHVMIATDDSEYGSTFYTAVYIYSLDSDDHYTFDISYNFYDSPKFGVQTTINTDRGKGIPSISDGKLIGYYSISNDSGGRGIKLFDCNEPLPPYFYYTESVLNTNYLFVGGNYSGEHTIIIRGSGSNYTLFTSGSDAGAGNYIKVVNGNEVKESIVGGKFYKSINANFDLTTVIMWYNETFIFNTNFAGDYNSGMWSNFNTVQLNGADVNTTNQSYQSYGMTYVSHTGVFMAVITDHTNNSQKMAYTTDKGKTWQDGSGKIFYTDNFFYRQKVEYIYSNVTWIAFNEMHNTIFYPGKRTSNTTKISGIYRYDLKTDTNTLFISYDPYYTRTISIGYDENELISTDSKSIYELFSMNLKADKIFLVNQEDEDSSPKIEIYKVHTKITNIVESPTGGAIIDLSATKIFFDKARPSVDATLHQTVTKSYEFARDPPVFDILFNGNIYGNLDYQDGGLIIDLSISGEYAGGDHTGSFEYNSFGITEISVIPGTYTISVNVASTTETRAVTENFSFEIFELIPDISLVANTYVFNTGKTQDITPDLIGSDINGTWLYTYGDGTPIQDSGGILTFIYSDELTPGTAGTYDINLIRKYSDAHIKDVSINTQITIDRADPPVPYIQGTNTNEVTWSPGNITIDIKNDLLSNVYPFDFSINTLLNANIIYDDSSSPPVFKLKGGATLSTTVTQPIQIITVQSTNFNERTHDIELEVLELSENIQLGTYNADFNPDDKQFNLNFLSEDRDASYEWVIAPITAGTSVNGTSTVELQTDTHYFIYENAGTFKLDVSRKSEVLADDFSSVYITINKIDQDPINIIFNDSNAHQFNYSETDPIVNLDISGGSGGDNTVVFNSNGGSINGNIFTYTSIGAYDISATKNGDINYYAISFMRQLDIIRAEFEGEIVLKEKGTPNAYATYDPDVSLVLLDFFNITKSANDVLMYVTNVTGIEGYISEDTSGFYFTDAGDYTIDYARDATDTVQSITGNTTFTVQKAQQIQIVPLTIKYDADVFYLDRTGETNYINIFYNGNPLSNNNQYYKFNNNGGSSNTNKLAMTKGTYYFDGLILENAIHFGGSTDQVQVTGSNSTESDGLTYYYGSFTVTILEDFGFMDISSLGGTIHSLNKIKYFETSPFIYDDTNKNIKIDISGGSGDGAISFVPDSVTIGNIFTYSDAGNYAITVTKAESTNYEQSIVNLNFVVDKGPQTTEIYLLDTTFDYSLNKFIELTSYANGGDGDGEYVYYFNGNTTADPSGFYFENAGTFDVVVEKLTSLNYLDFSQNIEVTINPIAHPEFELLLNGNVVGDISYNSFQGNLIVTISGQLDRGGVTFVSEDVVISSQIIPVVLDDADIFGSYSDNNVFNISINHDGTSILSLSPADNQGYYIYDANSIHKRESQLDDGDATWSYRINDTVYVNFENTSNTPQYDGYTIDVSGVSIVSQFSLDGKKYVHLTSEQLILFDYDVDSGNIDDKKRVISRNGENIFYHMSCSNDLSILFFKYNDSFYKESFSTLFGLTSPATMNNITQNLDSIGSITDNALTYVSETGAFMAVMYDDNKIKYSTDQFGTLTQTTLNNHICSNKLQTKVYTFIETIDTIDNADITGYSMIRTRVNHPIEKLFDGDKNTYVHSDWKNNTYNLNSNNGFLLEHQLSNNLHGILYDENGDRNNIQWTNDSSTTNFPDHVTMILPYHNAFDISAIFETTQVGSTYGFSATIDVYRANPANDSRTQIDGTLVSAEFIAFHFDDCVMLEYLKLSQRDPDYGDFNWIDNRTISHFSLVGTNELDLGDVENPGDFETIFEFNNDNMKDWNGSFIVFERGKNSYYGEISYDWDDTTIKGYQYYRIVIHEMKGEEVLNLSKLECNGKKVTRIEAYQANYFSWISYNENNEQIYYVNNTDNKIHIVDNDFTNDHVFIDSTLITVNDHIFNHYITSLNGNTFAFITNDNSDKITYATLDNNSIVFIPQDVQFTGKDVGSYDISATITGMTNYLDRTINFPFNILKIYQPTPITVGNRDFSYNASNKNIVISAFDINGGDTDVGFEINNDSTKYTYVNAGNYEITVKRPGNTNYYDLEQTFYISINPIYQTPLVFQGFGESYQASNDDLSYTLVVNGTESTGVLTFSGEYVTNGVLGYPETGIIYPNIFYVEATRDGDINYYPVYSGVVAITIDAFTANVITLDSPNAIDYHASNKRIDVSFTTHASVINPVFTITNVTYDGDSISSNDIGYNNLYFNFENAGDYTVFVERTSTNTITYDTSFVITVDKIDQVGLQYFIQNSDSKTDITDQNTTYEKKYDLADLSFTLIIENAQSTSGEIFEYNLDNIGDLTVDVYTSNSSLNGNLFVYSATGNWQINMIKDGDINYNSHRKIIIISIQPGDDPRKVYIFINETRYENNDISLAYSPNNNQLDISFELAGVINEEITFNVVETLLYGSNALAYTGGEPYFSYSDTNLFTVVATTPAGDYESKDTSFNIEIRRVRSDEQTPIELYATTYDGNYSRLSDIDYYPLNKEITLDISGASGTGADSFTLITGAGSGASIIQNNRFSYTDTGNYQIEGTVAQDRNYEEQSINVTFNIQPIDPDSITLNANVFTYDPSHYFNILANVNNIDYEDNVFTFQLEGNTFIDPSGFHYTEAGTYDLTIIKAQTTNYNEISKVFDVSINKAIQPDFSLLFDSNPFGDISYNPDDNTNEIELSLQNVYSTGTKLFTSTKLHLSGNKFKTNNTAGEYTINAFIDGDNNYLDKDIDFTFNILKIYQTTEISLNKTEFIYRTIQDGKKINIRGNTFGGDSGGDSGGNFSFRFNNNTLNDSIDTSGLDVSATPYPLVITKLGDDNYYDLSNEFFITINKREQDTIAFETGNEFIFKGNEDLRSISLKFYPPGTDQDFGTGETFFTGGFLNGTDISYTYYDEGEGEDVSFVRYDDSEQQYKLFYSTFTGNFTIIGTKYEDVNFYEQTISKDITVIETSGVILLNGSLESTRVNNFDPNGASRNFGVVLTDDDENVNSPAITFTVSGPLGLQKYEDYFTYPSAGEYRITATRDTQDGYADLSAIFDISINKIDQKNVSLVVNDFSYNASQKLITLEPTQDYNDGYTKPHDGLFDGNVSMEKDTPDNVYYNIIENNGIYSLSYEQVGQYGIRITSNSDVNYFEKTNDLVTFTIHRGVDTDGLRFAEGISNKIEFNETSLFYDLSFTGGSEPSPITFTVSGGSVDESPFYEVSFNTEGFYYENTGQYTVYVVKDETTNYDKQEKQFIVSVSKGLQTDITPTRIYNHYALDNYFQDENIVEYRDKKYFSSLRYYDGVTISNGSYIFNTGVSNSFAILNNGLEDKISYKPEILDVSLVALDPVSKVNIIDSGGKIYVLNNGNSYDSTITYGLVSGEYLLEDVPIDHPIAIVTTSSSITYRPDSDTIDIYVSNGVTSPSNDDDYYTFTINGHNVTIGNGSFKFMRGKTYKFHAGTGITNHPFKIHTDFGDTSSINDENESFNITIPSDQSGEIYYQCTAHPNMKANLSLYLKTVNNNSYDFYYGNVIVTVSNYFEQSSLYCYDHGYMGGENVLKYYANTINIDVSGGENEDADMYGDYFVFSQNGTPIHIANGDFKFMNNTLYRFNNVGMPPDGDAANALGFNIDNVSTSYLGGIGNNETTHIILPLLDASSVNYTHNTSTQVPISLYKNQGYNYYNGNIVINVDNSFDTVTVQDFNNEFEPITFYHESNTKELIPSTNYKVPYNPDISYLFLGIDGGSGTGNIHFNITKYDTNEYQPFISGNITNNEPYFTFNYDTTGSYKVEITKYGDDNFNSTEQDYPLVISEIDQDTIKISQTVFDYSANMQFYDLTNIVTGGTTQNFEFYFNGNTTADPSGFYYEKAGEYDLSIVCIKNDNYNEETLYVDISINKINQFPEPTLRTYKKYYFVDEYFEDFSNASATLTVDDITSDFDICANNMTIMYLWEKTVNDHYDHVTFKNGANEIFTLKNSTDDNMKLNNKSSTELSNNETHFISVTFDTSVNLYINGQPDIYVDNTINTITEIIINNENNENLKNFTIFDRSLGQDEIKYFARDIDLSHNRQLSYRKEKQDEGKYVYDFKDLSFNVDIINGPTANETTITRTNGSSNFDGNTITVNGTGVTTFKVQVDGDDNYLAYDKDIEFNVEKGIQYPLIINEHNSYSISGETLVIPFSFNNQVQLQIDIFHYMNTNININSNDFNPPYNGDFNTFDVIYGNTGTYNIGISNETNDYETRYDTFELKIEKAIDDLFGIRNARATQPSITFDGQFRTEIDSGDTNEILNQGRTQNNGAITVYGKDISFIDNIYYLIYSERGIFDISAKKLGSTNYLETIIYGNITIDEVNLSDIALEYGENADFNENRLFDLNFNYSTVAFTSADVSFTVVDSSTNDLIDSSFVEFQGNDVNTTFKYQNSGEFTVVTNRQLYDTNGIIFSSWLDNDISINVTVKKIPQPNDPEINIIIPSNPNPLTNFNFQLYPSDTTFIIDPSGGNGTGDYKLSFDVGNQIGAIFQINNSNTITTDTTGNVSYNTIGKLYIDCKRLGDENYIETDSKQFVITVEPTSNANTIRIHPSPSDNSVEVTFDFDKPFIDISFDYKLYIDNTIESISREDISYNITSDHISGNASVSFEIFESFDRIYIDRPTSITLDISYDDPDDEYQPNMYYKTITFNKRDLSLSLSYTLGQDLVVKDYTEPIIYDPNFIDIAYSPSIINDYTTENAINIDFGDQYLPSVPTYSITNNNNVEIGVDQNTGVVQFTNPGTFELTVTVKDSEYFNRYSQVFYLTLEKGIQGNINISTTDFSYNPDISFINILGLVTQDEPFENPYDFSMNFINDPSGIYFPSIGEFPLRITRGEGLNYFKKTLDVSINILRIYQDPINFVINDVNAITAIQEVENISDFVYSPDFTPRFITLNGGSIDSINKHIYDSSLHHSILFEFIGDSLNSDISYTVYNNTINVFYGNAGPQELKASIYGGLNYYDISGTFTFDISKAYQKDISLNLTEFDFSTNKFYNLLSDITDNTPTAYGDIIIYGGENGVHGNLLGINYLTAGAIDISIVKIDTNHNYYDKMNEYTININKINQTGFNLDVSDGYVYTSYDRTIDVSVNGGFEGVGDITITIDPPSSIATIIDNVVNYSDVGNFSLHVFKRGNETYNDASDNFTITIYPSIIEDDIFTQIKNIEDIINGYDTFDISVNAGDNFINLPTYEGLYEGMYIIIDEGTNIEERKKITGFGSVIVDSPFGNAHTDATIKIDAIPLSISINTSIDFSDNNTFIIDISGGIGTGNINLSFEDLDSGTNALIFDPNPVPFFSSDTTCTVSYVHIGNYKIIATKDTLGRYTEQTTSGEFVIQKGPQIPLEIDTPIIEYARNPNQITIPISGGSNGSNYTISDISNTNQPYTISFESIGTEITYGNLIHIPDDTSFNVIFTVNLSGGANFLDVSINSSLTLVKNVSYWRNQNVNSDVLTDDSNYTFGQVANVYDTKSLVSDGFSVCQLLDNGKEYVDFSTKGFKFKTCLR